MRRSVENSQSFDHAPFYGERKLIYPSAVFGSAGTLVVYSLFFLNSMPVRGDEGGPIEAAREGSPAEVTVASLRLMTPLSTSGSRAASTFSALVIAPVELAGRVVIPSGTQVSGTVVKRTAVGFGLIHERARLGIRFDSYQLPDGRRLPMCGRLRNIRNARESVSPSGEVRGILAADSPQSVLGGVWFKPSLISFPRSFVGLTGVAGSLWTHFALGPIGAISLLAARCVLFHMPEPEIQLPSGTELDIAVVIDPDQAPRFAQAVPPELAPELAATLAAQPYQLTRRNGRPVLDILNVALLGSREHIIAAFHASGWTEAQPVSVRSISRDYNAFTEKKGYSGAPVSVVLYQGKDPDLIFEKSLNDIKKRDHVRIWRSVADPEIWLAAATRDVSLDFNPLVLSFNHRIQLNIDLERQKIVDDLSFSKCADGAAYVARPTVPANTPLGRVTDGRLAVVRTHWCPEDGDATEPSEATSSNFVKRIARRLILEGRQYMERENAVYWSYRVVKWGVTRGGRTNRASSIAGSDHPPKWRARLAEKPKPVDSELAVTDVGEE